MLTTAGGNTLRVSLAGKDGDAFQSAHSAELSKLSSGHAAIACYFDAFFVGATTLVPTGTGFIVHTSDGHASSRRPSAREYSTLINMLRMFRTGANPAIMVGYRESGDNNSTVTVSLAPRTFPHGSTPKLDKEIIWGFKANRQGLNGHPEELLRQLGATYIGFLLLQVSYEQHARAHKAQFPPFEIVKKAAITIKNAHLRIGEDNAVRIDVPRDERASIDHLSFVRGKRERWLTAIDYTNGTRSLFQSVDEALDEYTRQYPPGPPLPPSAEAPPTLNELLAATPVPQNYLGWRPRDVPVCALYLGLQHCDSAISRDAQWFSVFAERGGAEGKTTLHHVNDVLADPNADVFVRRQAEGVVAYLAMVGRDEPGTEDRPHLVEKRDELLAQPELSALRAAVEAHLQRGTEPPPSEDDSELTR